MIAPSPRVALITGAGSGIGRAVARALFGAGYKTVLAGRSRERLERVMEDLGEDLGEGRGASPADARAISCDVGDPASVRALFAETESAFGRLDLLFNNAGTFTPSQPLEEIPYDRWTEAVRVNLTGVFLCTQEAMRLMKRQRPGGGRIINNGSISAHVPRPHAAAYTATKHAVSGLTKSTALEGRAYGIACGQIDIGNAATGMTDAMAAGVLQADGSRKAEPRMDVEDVARAVLYMASLPLDANVLSMTVMATGMPYVGRG